MAGHQARHTGTRYIVCGPGLASNRRRPVTSSVERLLHPLNDGCSWPKEEFLRGLHGIPQSLQSGPRFRIRVVYRT
jgi:hypothetical protein